MRSLRGAARNPDAGGTPLPGVFPQLEWQRAHIRRSEVTLIAGEPGAGKSTVALWHAKEWVVRDGLIGLYLSADSSEMVAASRALAMLTGTPVHVCEEEITAGVESALEDLARLHGLAFSFEPDIALEAIQLELDAFEEMWGKLPDFLVIDNLTDVEGQSGDEFTELRNTMKLLTYVARTAGVAVIVLHHTSEGVKTEPDGAPPRKAIHGKVNQKPAVIFTVAGDEDFIRVAVVKNRFGPSDKSGRKAVKLAIDHESMTFRSWP